MRLSTFEKDNIIVLGPFTKTIYDTLLEIKEKVSLKDFICTAYLAYDFLSIQNYYQNKHNIYFHEDLTDLEIKKIGTTYSRQLQRFYREENSKRFLDTMIKKDEVRAYSIFSSSSAQYRSKFYVIKDTTPRSEWFVISNHKELSTAKATILKINDRKIKKGKESINVSGFDFTAVVEALNHSTDKNYQALSESIAKDGITTLFTHKIIRTNNSNYNLLGNLKKEIRKQITHESQDVMELDLVGAFPGILPNYVYDFLTTFDQQYSSKLDRINLNQPEHYRINLEKLKEELVTYKSNCSDIYLHAQTFINNTFSTKFDRKELKQAYLVFLFADPKQEGKRPPICTYVKKYVKLHYPELYKALLAIKNLITYNQVAIQIQNKMALMMKEIIKTFQKTNAQTPFIPIYDCFITTKDNQQLVYHTIKQVLEKHELSHIKIKTKNLTEENVKENVLNGLSTFDYSVSLRNSLYPVNNQNNNKYQVKNNQENNVIESGVPNILSGHVLPSRYKIDQVRDKIGFTRLYFHYLAEKKYGSQVNKFVN